LNYDLQKDFEPIGLTSVNPQLMVAKKALPADDLKGLVAWMKANPGKITFVNQNAAAKLLALGDESPISPCKISLVERSAHV
jgi:tripartite-type tricarboxylate transporter receptor subunit TctC